MDEQTLAEFSDLKQTIKRAQEEMEAGSVVYKIIEAFSNDRLSGDQRFRAATEAVLSYGRKTSENT